MAFFVWQVPPPSVLMEIPRLVLQILSVEMISLHNLQFFFLQGSVILGVSTSRTLFFTRILLNDLGLLYATIGTEVKISLAAVSFWRRWKCFFNADGRRATLGCQSQTKINCGSRFIFSVSSNSLLRGIVETSLMDFLRSSDLYPLFSKYDESLAQLLRKSSFWLHIRRTLMNNFREEKILKVWISLLRD